MEENTAIGNSNGIVVFRSATSTVVRGNIAAGNPPIQVSVGIAGSTGVDIWDQSAAGQTVFDRNICGTSINAPCPNLSPVALPKLSPMALPKKPQ